MPDVERRISAAFVGRAMERSTLGVASLTPDVELATARA
jgi:hypothetical protein